MRTLQVKKVNGVTMSKRRFQFLDQLVEMYQKTRLPIHYEALAKAVGVSKWTAYDMLKQIEKSGYVTRSYETNPNETGRSQVVFAPTAKAAELFRQQRQSELPAERWDETVREIRHLLDSMGQMSIQELMGKMLEEIPGKRSNLEFCGYIVGMLLAYLKQLGGKTESVIRALIRKTSGHHAGLLMFVGTVLGTAIQTVNEELGSEIAELVGEYVELLDGLSGGEQTLLSELVRETLA